MQIEGSKIVVTGGASGIGAGMARRFAAMGAAGVVVADLDADGAGAVAEEIGGTAIACDVASEESVRALVAQATETYGGIDLFCANAGVGAGGGLDIGLDRWDLSWKVNVLGPVIAAREVIPVMEAAGGGTLLITASAAGLITGPTSFNYSVSKHAAVGVAEWLAVNTGPTIKIGCLCPTIVDTPMVVHFDGLQEALSVEDVAEAAAQGLADDRFLILPAPQPLQLFRAKADDYDAFVEMLSGRIAAMRAAQESSP